MAASKMQQIREADLVLRAWPRGWKVVKNRTGPVDIVIDGARREEIVREVRLAVAPRLPKIVYLTEKENAHG